MAVDTTAFFPEALDANRSGRLTDTQKHNIGKQEAGTRRSELTWALFALAVGAIILFVPGFRGSSLVHIGAPVLCVLVAVGLLVWSMTGADPLARDLRRGRVESVEGAIGKRSSTLTSDGAHDATSYFLDVGSVTFHVKSATYADAPEAGHVRVYYLPRSRHIVNLERLPDGPAPDISSPQDIVHALGSTILTRNREQRNEARAGVKAWTDQMQAQITKNAVPPPAAPADAPPLAEAIVGTWHSTMMTATFREDGTVEVEMFGGVKRSGHWSVDDAGRLQSDVTGQAGAAEAWIRGDQLTISLDGTALTFDRVTG